MRDKLLIKWARPALDSRRDLPVCSEAGFWYFGRRRHTITGRPVRLNPERARAVALPPKQRAKTSPMAPSVWSPRPIPQPAPERRTADPHTPTQKELAARVQQRASLAAVAPGPKPASATRSAVDCGAAWTKVMGETDRVLAAGTAPGTNPKGEDPKLVRNRAISAEYARLYQANPAQMRWAGLASVVSTQGGCAMRDAGVAVGRSGAALTAAQANERAVEKAGSVLNLVPGGPLLRAEAAAALAGAEKLHRLTTGTQKALYDTNEEIFKDIYPAMRMYNDHGLTGVQSGPGGCGDSRPNPDPTKRGVPGTTIGVAPELRSALRSLDRGQIPTGSRQIAEYEQTTIVQGRIWNKNRDAADALSLNQFATTADDKLATEAEQLPVVGGPIASGIRSAGRLAREGMYHAMRARRTSFALTTDCLPPDAPGEIPFRGDFTKSEPRVDYYDDLMREYDRMNRDGRAAAMAPTIVGRDPAPPSSGYLPRPHGR